MKIKNYLYKAGTLSMSGIMALSLCAPALSASASHRAPAHHARTERVYFWDSFQSNTHKGRRHTRKNHTRRTRRTRTNKKSRSRNARKPSKARKANPKRSKKNAKARKELEHDKAILRQMNGQLNKMTHSLHHQKARHIYQTLRKHGYSYNQSIAILASVERESQGTYANFNKNHNAFGYFYFGGSYMKAYNRYAKRTHQPRYNIMTQLNFMNRGKKSFKKYKGTQYHLFNQFYRKMLDAHGYFVPTHKQAMGNIRLARVARKG